MRNSSEDSLQHVEVRTKFHFKQRDPLAAG